MIVSAMRHKNVAVNTLVSPNKIQDYYRKHAAEFTSKEEVKLRMIMIPSRAETGNAAAQKAMAEEILGKLANGANFDRLAQIYSEDSTRDLGGDWGWIERKTLAAPLEQVAFNLPVGRISRIIDYNGNYVGVTEPPEEIFGKLMSIPDDVMPAYYRLLLDRDVDPALPPVEAKRALARELTAHFGGGEEAARAAEAHFDRLHVEHEAPEEVEDAMLPEGETVHLPALIADLFGLSRSEARRLLSQGGVKLDGEPLSDSDLDVPAERLRDRLLQVGRRRFKRLRGGPS